MLYIAPMDYGADETGAINVRIIEYFGLWLMSSNATSTNRGLGCGIPEQLFHARQRDVTCSTRRSRLTESTSHRLTPEK